MYSWCNKKIFFLYIQKKAGSVTLREEQELEEEDVEEEEDEGDGHLFTSQHEYPLVQQTVNEYALSCLSLCGHFFKNEILKDICRHPLISFKLLN